MGCISNDMVVKLIWVFVSLLSFIFLLTISQQLQDLYFPAFVSSTPGNLFSCGVFFFIFSVGCSILSYFNFFLNNGPISILLNVSSAAIFCFCTLAFVSSFGTKIFYDRSSSLAYQNSIVSCTVDSIICDQFKQTIGDISMQNNELKLLVVKYIQERTINASIKSLIIMTVWIIIHSIYLNYLFNDDEKKYNKAETDVDENLDDISKMSDVEKEGFDS